MIRNASWCSILNLTIRLFPSSNTQENVFYGANAVGAQFTKTVVEFATVTKQIESKFHFPRIRASITIRVFL